MIREELSNGRGRLIRLDASDFSFHRDLQCREVKGDEVSGDSIPTIAASKLNGDESVDRVTLRLGCLLLAHG
jgi:hypothetical protein